LAATSLREDEAALAAAEAAAAGAAGVGAGPGGSDVRLAAALTFRVNRKRILSAAVDRYGSVA